MKLTKALLLFFIFQSIASIVLGQQNLVYNHYFINPYLYNPSYIAQDGYTELFINYRKTWAGFEGAPRTATVNLQVPLNYKSGFGINLYNDQAGVFQTNTGYASFAYQIYFDKSLTNIHKLGFGLSAGATTTKVDLNKVSNPDDPAYKYASVLGFQGQFGLNYQFNNLRVGFALPRLLKPRVPTNNINNAINTYSPFESTLTTVSYNFHLNHRVSFEPFVLYRTEKNIPSQFELLGVLRIDNLAWIGGAYRQQNGASAFFGFNIKEQMKVGYAYEFAPNQVTGIGSGSHEVQLIVRLSKHKKERPQPTDSKEEVAEEEQEPEDITEPEKQKDKEIEEPIVVQQQENPPKQEAHPETEPIELPVKQAQPIETKQAIENIQPGTIEDQKEVAKALDGSELAPGHYVVVGAFRSVQNAKNYKMTLKKAGYPADVAFYPAKNYYIVHMGINSTIEEAKELRNLYRMKSRYSFRDTWILSIE